MDPRGRTTEKERGFRSSRARARHLQFLASRARLGMVLALTEEPARHALDALLRAACPRRRATTLAAARDALLERWARGAGPDRLTEAVAHLGLEVTVHPQRDPRYLTIWRDAAVVAHVGIDGGVW